MSGPALRLVRLAGKAASPALLLFPLLFAGQDARASLSAGAVTLELAGGHDDDVLADPEGLDVLRGVAAPFFASALDMDLTFRGLTGRGGRLTAGLRGAWGAYGGDGPENESDLRARLRFDRPVGGGVWAELRAEGGRFRRSGLPLFDLDYLQVEGSLSRSVGAGWYAGLRGEAGVLDYPGRSIDETPGANETDRRVGGGAFIARRVGTASLVELSAAERRGTSNDPLAEYDGPVFGARGVIAVGGVLVLPYATAAIRGYDDYPVLVPSGDSWIDEGEERRDVTVRVGAAAERSVSRRIALVMDIAYTRQTSNVDGFAFDQLRAVAGVRVGIWSRTEPPVLAAPPRSLAPEPLGGPRYRFLCRAPDAGEVSLVGGWSAWRVDAHPMKRDASGIWSVEASVPAGTWRYAFVVDGEWVAPEDAARYEDDGFGGVLGLLDAGL